MILTLILSTLAVLIALCVFGIGWINSVERRLSALQANKEITR